MKIEARAMSWPKSREFNKLRRELKEKGCTEEIIGEEAINFVVTQVYPEIDAETLTQADAFYLFEKTMELSKQLTIAEEKN